MVELVKFIRIDASHNQIIMREHDALRATGSPRCVQYYAQVITLDLVYPFTPGDSAMPVALECLSTKLPHRIDVENGVRVVVTQATRLVVYEAVKFRQLILH